MMAAIYVLLSILTLQTPSASATQAAAGKPDEGGSAPFTVGVLRRDGIVSPFAVFDGKKWSVPWPADLRTAERPIKPGGFPVQWWGKTGPLKEMTAWVDGVNRGIVRLARPVVLRIMCEWRLGIASDYRSQETVPQDPVQPYPKDGLAISGTQRADPIDVLSAESPEWATTAGFIKEEFDKAEEESIKLYTDWRNPIPRSVRRSTPVELEAMYRAPMDQDGWIAYYVEGVKRYPPGPDDDDCGLVASASGWMFVGPGGKRSIELRGIVTYCDRRGVTYMLPLGLIKTQGKSYWVFQLSGYGREGYLVVRPTPKRADPIAHYSGAFCPLS